MSQTFSRDIDSRFSGHWPTTHCTSQQASLYYDSTTLNRWRVIVVANVLFMCHVHFNQPTTSPARLNVNFTPSPGYASILPHAYDADFLLKHDPRLARYLDSFHTMLIWSIWVNTHAMDKASDTHMAPHWRPKYHAYHLQNQEHNQWKLPALKIACSKSVPMWQCLSRPICTGELWMAGISRLVWGKSRGV